MMKKANCINKQPHIVRKRPIFSFPELSNHQITKLSNYLISPNYQIIKSPNYQINNLSCTREIQLPHSSFS